MTRPSSIARLPAELRELIGRLRERGRTIDEILAKLTELDVAVSRSALGRHVKQIDAIGEEIRRSRAAAEAIVARLGDAPEGRVARLNIELMHGLIMKLMVGEDGAAASLDPQEAYFAATALQRLAMAAKQDVERELKIRQTVTAAAAAAVETAAKGRGLSAETVQAFRAAILGLGAT